MINTAIKSDEERAAFAIFQRRQARFVSDRPTVASGQKLTPAESEMLEQIMRLENSRDPNRSATIGMLIRAMYQMLVSAGQLAPSVAPEEYEGWLQLWGVEKVQPVEE